MVRAAISELRRRDIDDALAAGIIKPDDLPRQATAIVGETHKSRINTMVTDIVVHSSGQARVAMGSEVRDAVEVLKESGRGNTGRTIGVITKGLVIFQIFVTCVLLVGALLQTQSILRQQTLGDPGDGVHEDDDEEADGDDVADVEVDDEEE